MTVPYRLTPNGYETQWQVNFLAPFAFTLNLLPLLLSTASRAGNSHRVRVVNVSSDAALAQSKTLHLDDVNMTETRGVMELW